VDRAPSLGITGADTPTLQCKGIAATRHNRHTTTVATLRSLPTTATAATHRHGPTIRLRPADIPRRDLTLRRIILRPAVIAEVAVIMVDREAARAVVVRTVAARAVVEDHADSVAVAAAVDRMGVQVAAATAAVTTKS
jgi:hypothetical protein